MTTITRIVDNRVFLLGLDELYRSAMKRHETGELLNCAHRVASELKVKKGDYPVEGYYSEDETLTEYFLLARTLQEVGAERESDVRSLPEYRRLLEVTSSPIFGAPVEQETLLPRGMDSLSRALRATAPAWTIPRLTKAAHYETRQWNDISLVGLAALAGDTVVLTALRESVVLYSGVYASAPPMDEVNTPKIEYVWKVDPELAQRANGFIEVFNGLFAESLPSADADHASRFWDAAVGSNLVGRCVRLGWDDTRTPVMHYHWGIYQGKDRRLGVQEFWHPEIWTTARYSEALPYEGPCREF